MALSEKSRTRIYTGLEPVLGEEATAEMLAHFPARDSDEPATREFVRAEITELRGHTDAGFAELRGHTDAGFAELRGHTDAGFAELRGHTDAGFAELRGHTDAGLASVRADLETLRADMHASLQRMVFALVAVIAAATGIILSALFSLQG